MERYKTVTENVDFAHHKLNFKFCSSRNVDMHHRSTSTISENLVKIDLVYHEIIFCPREPLKYLKKELTAAERIAHMARRLVRLSYAIQRATKK